MCLERPHSNAGGVMRGFAEIEFIISVFVFITTISFVTFLIINNIPLFHTTAVSDQLKTRSYQYSELFLFDEGYPTNWYTDPRNSKRIGLSIGRRYFIDKNKVDSLRSLCSSVGGYALVKQKIGSIDFDIIVEASYLDETPVSGASKIICRPQVLTQIRPQFQTTRLGVLSTDNSIIKIKTTVIG